MKSRVIASCLSHKIQAGLQGGSVTQSIQQHLLTLVGTTLRLMSQVPREQGPVMVHPGGSTTLCSPCSCSPRVERSRGRGEASEETPRK